MSFRVIELAVQLHPAAKDDPKDKTCGPASKCPAGAKSDADKCFPLSDTPGSPGKPTVKACGASLTLDVREQLRAELRRRLAPAAPAATEPAATEP